MLILVLNGTMDQLAVANIVHWYDHVLRRGDHWYDHVLRRGDHWYDHVLRRGDHWYDLMLKKGGGH